MTSQTIKGIKHVWLTREEYDGLRCDSYSERHYEVATIKEPVYEAGDTVYHIDADGCEE